MSAATLSLSAGNAVVVCTRNREGQPIEPPRRAMLQKHRPYHHPRGQYVTDGWDVSYPDATEQWHSHGGWVPTDHIVPLAAVRARLVELGARS